MADTKVWGIHTKDDNLFLKENVVAIGWNEMGDISDIQSDREKLKQKFPLVYPNKKLSDKERQKRIFDKSLPIYLNIICFFPSALYYLFVRNDFDKRQKRTIFFALCFTIVWLFMVFMTF